MEGHFDDGGQWREGQPVGETKAAERVGGNGVGAEEVTEALGALSGLGGEVEGDGEMDGDATVTGDGEMAEMPL